MYELITKKVTVRGHEHDYRVLIHPGAVSIVAVRDGTLALIRQYRPAVEEEIWEVPAGTLGPEEDPRVCAMRELEEETGLRARHIEKLGEFYLAPGYSTERMHIYLASELELGEQSLDDTEQISEVAWVTPDRAHQMVSAGQIRDAKTIAALYMVGVNHLSLTRGAGGRVP